VEAINPARSSKCCERLGPDHVEDDGQADQVPVG
jgi:hypothetical protein